MLLMPLPDDESFQVRFVVPKSVPTDINGQVINLTVFQDYPELVEGAGLYHFECAPTFLFGDFWMEQGIIYFRPQSPIEAKHVFVNLTTKHANTPEAQEYISKHAVYRPENRQESPYFIMDLSYNEVEFNSAVDVGYHREDYLMFCAKRLQELRNLCNQRYQEYYIGSTEQKQAE